MEVDKIKKLYELREAPFLAINRTLEGIDESVKNVKQSVEQIEIPPIPPFPEIPKIENITIDNADDIKTDIIEEIKAVKSLIAGYKQKEISLTK